MIRLLVFPMPLATPARAPGLADPSISIARPDLCVGMEAFPLMLGGRQMKVYVFCRVVLANPSSSFQQWTAEGGALPRFWCVPFQSGLRPYPTVHGMNHHSFPLPTLSLILSQIGSSLPSCPDIRGRRSRGQHSISGSPLPCSYLFVTCNCQVPALPSRVCVDLRMVGCPLCFRAEVLIPG
jgi:hypothetical protein